jgi:ribosomal protein S12 methylthiotransferase
VTQPNSFTLISLGCPKNRVDSEKILSVMTESGFAYTEDPSAVRIVIVNTCAFIEPAVEESIDVILDLKAENPESFLVVAGCLPLRYQQQLQETLPEVNLFLTPAQIGDLPNILNSRLFHDCSVAEGSGRSYLPVGGSRVLTTSGYAYLKIAEGCRRGCRYCTIPSIRGPLKSFDISDLEKEARFLAARGVKELVVVAQDVTAYGMDRGEKGALPGLLEKLEKIDGIAWIRLMYLHPAGIPKGLGKLISGSSKVLPYLDIPFQHVADSVLKAMGRPWKGERTRKLVDSLRAQIPRLVLRTTFMVGFPGEGEKEFGELRDFVESSGIEHVGIFAYSPEEGTPAHRLGDSVPQDIKLARVDEIRSIHAKFTAKRNRTRKGAREQALVEGISPETELLLQGRTWDQAPEIDGVLYITEGNAVAGEIHTVKITGSHGPDLFGKIIG